jgi:hypothetical protein
VVDVWEAQVIAAPWLGPGPLEAVEAPVDVREFDEGYVLWRVLPPAAGLDVGSGRVVVDRTTGEPSFWPSVPVSTVMDMYRAFREANPIHPLTFDPVAQAFHDRARAPFPQRVADLRLADGRSRTGRGMKGDGTPRPHPIVRDFFAELPVELRDRGHDRCAEVSAISDTMYLEDARRHLTGRLPLTPDEARTGLFAGAEITTRWVREPNDPLNGEPAAPCRSCLALLRHCGFALQLPDDPSGGDER